MGSEFLLLITLESALSLLLSAVLDSVNLICIDVFSSVSFQIDYKNTKTLPQLQKYLLKNSHFRIIFRNFAI
jgi:hypothetical protein